MIKNLLKGLYNEFKVRSHIIIDEGGDDAVLTLIGIFLSIFISNIKWIVSLVFITTIWIILICKHQRKLSPKTSRPSLTVLCFLCFLWLLGVFLIALKLRHPYTLISSIS